MTHNKIPIEIKEIFDSEYSWLKRRFVISCLSVEAAWDNSDLDINKPGVYVFWDGRKVIKVGKHQINSKFRACQHLNPNNPKNSADMDMSKLNRAATELILFNVKDNKDIHWLLGLEYFLEKKLEPRNRSLRNG